MIYRHFGERIHKTSFCLALTVLALFCYTQPLQAQNCVAAPGGKYVNATSTYYRNPISAFSDSACANSSGTVGVGSYGWVYGAIPVETAISVCQALLPELEDVSASPLSVSDFYRCTVGGDGGSGGRSSGGEVNRPTYAPGLNLPQAGLRLRAFDGPDSGIHFQRLGIYYIGNQAVLAMGFLDAVDVWANIGSGYEVCFPQFGRIVFLDAASSPRSLEDVAYLHDDAGFTCASLDRAGTLVLVQLTDGETPPEVTTPPQRENPSESTQEQEVTVIRPGTDDPLDTAIALENCAVTTLLNLRLRRAPWGKIRHVIPRFTTLTAQARTKHWFQLTYDDVTGWVAGWYVLREGDCAFHSAGA